MALSRDEIRMLAEEQARINRLASENAEEQRSIRDVILDQAKQLKFQQTLKQDILKATNQIYRLEYDIRTEYDKELGTRQSQISIEKDIEKTLKSKKSLEQDIISLSREGSSLGNDLSESLQEQVRRANILLDTLKKQAKTSKEIRSNFGVSGFQGLSEIFQKIGGKASQLATPFEKMAEASREVVKDGVENNNKISERQAILDKIRKGELSASKKNLEGIEIIGKKGKAIYGKSAQDALKAGTANVKNIGAPIGKFKLGMKGLSAGFKALGPIITKALGPLALVKMAVDAIQFFVSAMFTANKEAVGLARNLSASAKEGDKLRNFYKDQKNLLESQYKLTSELVNAQGELSQLSALSNVYSVDALDAQIQMTKELGLSVDEASHLNKLFATSKESSTENLDIAFDTVAQYANQTGYLFNTTKILGKASKVSGQLLASFKGSTKELIKAVLQTERLGINLEDAKNISGNLLDFESSISNELEAELLTGKDLNLERARSLALQGDFAGAAAEALKNVGGIAEFQEMNVLQQNALAKAAGLTVDQLSDALITQKFQGTETGKQIARLKEAGMVEQANALAAGKLTGEQLETSLKQLDAQQKFNLTVARAKEIFSDLVDGGALQTLADALQGLADSSLLKGYAEKGEAKRIAQSTEDNKNATQLQKDITKEAAEKVTQATTADDISDVAKASLAGAAIGSIIPGVGTAIGAGLGAVGAYIKNIFDQKAADKALENATLVDKDLNPETAEDFIIRPGQKPLKFRKDDVVIGGTNLGGNNQEVVTLLRELITAVKSSGNISIDGRSLNTAMKTSGVAFG